MSKQSFVILSVIILLATAVSSNQIDVTVARQDDAALSESAQTRVPHSQIRIDSPDDFVNLGFSGNGSESLPFLIEDLIITSVGQDILDASCISISGCPGIYYTIRNCMVSGSRGTAVVEYAGISLESGYAQIEGSEIWNCTMGIGTEGIPITIDDCRLWNCSESAIVIGNSNDCTIEYSRIELYYFQGLKISGSSNITIHANLFLCDPLGNPAELGYHLWIEKCENIRLLDNELRGGTAVTVLFARYCCDLLVKNNTLTSGGGVAFGVYSSNSTEVIDCTFEGESLSMQLLPIFHIGGEPDFQTAWNSYVKNCTFTDFSMIRVWYVENSTITNCHFFNASVAVAAEPGRILYNSLVNGSIEIYQAMNGIEVAHNIITEAGAAGIWDSGVNSYIHHNIVIGTGLNNSVGIDLSNRSIIHLNTIRNFHYGIYGPGSLNTGCVITNNTIQENTIGLYLGMPADENRIYYNYFIDNDIGAEDNGWSNQWDDGLSMGNYWTEILFPGVYSIPGDSPAVDRYAKPYRPLDEVIADNWIVLVMASTGVVVVFLLAVILRRRKV